MRGTRGLSLAIVGMAIAVSAQSQEVISARAGVIHFLEGSVFIDDQPVAENPGTFPSIKEGSTLRTAKGRAEVLLTPNVFLRVDEYSAVRMLGTALTDTRFDFVRGAVVIDAVKAEGSIPVVMLYGQSQIRFPKAGVYRLDSDTNVLQTYSGEAEVAPSDGKRSTVDSSHLYFFGLGTLTTKFTDGTDDDFYDWARSRYDAIQSENELAQQTAADGADLDNPPPTPAGIIPYTGPLPSYGYAVPGGGVWLGSVFDNSLYGPPYPPGYFSGPMLFPVFLIVRPYRGPHKPEWPGRTGTTYISGGTLLHTGSPYTSRYPTWLPRPITPIQTHSGINIGRSAVSTYHPAVPVYHPAAPVSGHAAVGHAIGHR